jgi:hypothetical protein
VEGAIDLWVRVMQCPAGAECGRCTLHGDVAAAMQSPGSDPPARPEPTQVRLMSGGVGSGVMRMLPGSGRREPARPMTCWRRLRCRKDLLCQRVTLDGCCPLTLKVLVGHRFALEQLLIEVGDKPYLAGRLADLYSEQYATAATWQDLYGGQVPALLPDCVGHPPAQPAPAADEIEATRQRLARLIQVKEYEDHYRQARGELKRRTSWLVTVVLSLAVASFATATAFLVDDLEMPLAAAAAGAAGAALGGLIKLRDQVSLGSEIRQFRPFFLGQVVTGAAAGLVTFLVQQTGLITISGPEAVGVTGLAFAVGFSEAAFVGLLDRLVAAVGEPDKEGKSAPQVPVMRRPVRADGRHALHGRAGSR